MATEFGGSELALLGDLVFYQSAWIDSLVSGHHEGHELEVADFPARFADALRRGRACGMDPYIGMDFFDYADRPLEELRAEWNILPKVGPSPDVS